MVRLVLVGLEVAHEHTGLCVVEGLHSKFGRGQRFLSPEPGDLHQCAVLEKHEDRLDAPEDWSRGRFDPGGHCLVDGSKRRKATRVHLLYLLYLLYL